MQLNDKQKKYLADEFEFLNRVGRLKEGKVTFKLDELDLIIKYAAMSLILELSKLQP